VNKKIVWAAVAATIISGPGVLAEESVIDHLINSCQTDIENYCSQVTPGEGRLVYCMAAHEDKISSQCNYALYQTAALLEQLAAALNYVAQECGEDIQTLCSDVAIGEGRVLACLEANDEKVSGSCKQAVSDTIAE
jgi:hypothetical protein